MEPGWRKALIRPRPGGSLTHARTSHLSPYGRFSCRWAIRDGKLLVDVEVPPNASALLVLPGLEETIGSGQRSYSVDWVNDPAWPPSVLQPPPGRPQLIDEVVLD